ncbi:MAG TPA: hypothetical protein VN823_02045, partial [Stellaceae bacterium]|nr:hypothetical protein [Stellaceae bacterium]
DPQSQLIHPSAKGWRPFGLSKMTRFQIAKQGEIRSFSAFLGSCGDFATVSPTDFLLGRHGWRPESRCAGHRVRSSSQIITVLYQDITSGSPLLSVKISGCAEGPLS